MKKDHFHVFVESRLGPVPVKVSCVSLVDAKEVVLKYRIDLEHPDCPSVMNLPKFEYDSLTSEIEERVPMEVKLVLERHANKMINR